MPRKSFSELTPEEVLLLAIDVEKANGARLRVFADLFTDFSPEAAGFFAQLAFEEEQRSRQLEKAYELRHGEHRRAVPEVDLREFIEPYDLDDAEHQVFDSLSLRSALESLLSMKCKARAFYGQALEKADEPKLQALFRELVDFEAEHVQWIEARLDALGESA